MLLIKEWFTSYHILNSLLIIYMEVDKEHKAIGKSIIQIKFKNYRIINTQEVLHILILTRSLLSIYLSIF